MVSVFIFYKYIDGDGLNVHHREATKSRNLV